MNVSRLVDGNMSTDIHRRIFKLLGSLTCSMSFIDICMYVCVCAFAKKAKMNGVLLWYKIDTVLACWLACWLAGHI